MEKRAAPLNTFPRPFFLFVLAASGMAFGTALVSAVPDSVRIKIFLSANQIVSTAIFRDTLWAGAFDGGIVKICRSDNSIIQLTTDNGLSGNCVNKLVFNNAGILWAGTDNGITRISGSGIVGYSKTATTSIGVVSDLAVLGNRVIGVCNCGPVVFNGNEFTMSAGLTPAKPRHIAFDDDSTLWIAGATGIFKSNDFGTTIVPISHAINPDSIYDISTDIDRTIWFALGDTVACYAHGDWKFFSTMAGDLVHTTNLCVRTVPGGIAAAGPKGVSLFTGGQWKRIAVLTGYASTDAGFSNLQDISFFDTTKFIFGSKARLCIYDGTEIKDLTVSGLENNDIMFCAADTNNNLWVSPRFNRGGLHYFDGTHWMYYSKYELLLASNDQSCLAIDPNGGYWFGSNFGFSYMQNGIWKRYTQSDGLPFWRISDCAIAPDSTVWAACVGGVMHYANSQWITYDTTSGLMSRLIEAIAIALDGTVICGGKGGIALLSNGQFIPDRSPGAPREKIIINSIKAGLWGYVAAGSDGCYIKINNKPWKIALQNIICQEVDIDSGNRIWVGTSEGLYVLDTGGVELLHLTSKQGLPSRDYIVCVTLCRNGTAWVGTPNGLASIKVHWSDSAHAKQMKKPASRPSGSVTAAGPFRVMDLLGRTIASRQERTRKQLRIPPGTYLKKAGESSGKFIQAGTEHHSPSGNGRVHGPSCRDRRAGSIMTLSPGPFRLRPVSPHIFSSKEP